MKTVLAGIFLFGFAGVACAGEFTQPGGQVVLNGTASSVKAGDEQGPVAEVKPGERLTITGVCVADAESADHLRVMLTLADNTGEAGYHVLATEQALGTDGLNVRVPDLPETTNRDFNVRVFRLDEESPQMCNAGTIHVGGPGKHNLG